MMDDAKQLTGALSDDIRLLGDLLGVIICDQHDSPAFDLVEQVRIAAKARRSGNRQAAALYDLIESRDLPALNILTKAFSNYFQLINIAEDQQRIRVLRDREAKGTLGESIEAAIQTLHDQGYDADHMRALLDKLRVRLVLTAHPTEAKRREVLVKLRRIAELLDMRDRREVLLPREAARIEARILEEIEELWQTRPNRQARPTVADEVAYGVYFLTSTIMEVLVDVFAELREKLAIYYPEADWTELPPVLRYGSWMGGDRDGNPFVTPEVTLEALATMRRAVQQSYLDDITQLALHMTQSTDEVPASAPLHEALAQADDLAEQFPGEPYRQMMTLIHRRLAADAYRTGDDLLADLSIVQQSLAQNRGLNAAYGDLGRFIDKVRLFGLRLAPLEIREDARRHGAAIAELFRAYAICEDYQAQTEAEKQTLLMCEIANPRPLFPAEPDFSEATTRWIATWRMIAQAHAQYGADVIDSVIASMTRQPSDMLLLLLLAGEVGILADVDLVPLFETIDDLERAPQVLEALFTNKSYYDYLKQRGMRQQVMIGYSDSGKDGGYLASAWHLYKTQQRMADVCHKHGVLLELFHGRGGSIGRGGAPPDRAILAKPPAAMRGSMRMTEQGEVIAYRYTNPAIAWRHMNQTLHAAMLATATSPDDQSNPAWHRALDIMSEVGRAAYRKLVYETPAFLDYWQQATPIHELTHLHIGSRPARRSTGGFEAIRAIPWVFSWTQSRAIVPSWYGIGHGLQAFCEAEAGGLDLLQEMYRAWHFFRAVIENAQLGLAKADMGIAALYSALVQDEAIRAALFADIRAEHERAQQWICKIIGQAALLDNSPVLKRSIERRNPYVDPLNVIQVTLLRRLRRHDPDSEAYYKLMSAVLATVNGIAAGLKTTG